MRDYHSDSGSATGVSVDAFEDIQGPLKTLPEVLLVSRTVSAQRNAGPAVWCVLSPSGATDVSWQPPPAVIACSISCMAVYCRTPVLIAHFLVKFLLRALDFGTETSSSARVGGSRGWIWGCPFWNLYSSTG